MSKFTRPTFNVDDDDLERLQREFFENEQSPSAKVYRKFAPPPVGDKRRSLFAQRLASSSTSDSVMPSLEDPSMPSLENPNMPSLETPTMPSLEQEQVEYEPVMDPHPEPHMPVSKKMIDLTSMLGQVLGEIKEHNVEKFSPPTLSNTISENKPARGQHNGFPKPVHRSEFKKRLEAQKNKSKSRLDAPPQVQQTAQVKDATPQVIGEDENDQRIQAMSEQELEEARQEIMNTLSPESIAMLMKGLKNKKTEKKVTFDIVEKPIETDKDVDNEQDLLKMKDKYFADVPLENDKLAWMDSRFLTPKLKKQQQQQQEESVPSEAEKVYRQVRFDLQGRILDPSVDIPRHQGLHHHGDEPEKAGYTIAELFHLTRSQVPSQRSMVLNTLARIILLAKKNKDKAEWQHIWAIFITKEHAASIYLRSALDDRHLVVMISAIKALTALVLDDAEDDQAWEAGLINKTADFNQFLGHIAKPVLPQGTTRFKRKGLNDKLTELVDRIRQQPNTEEEIEDDAALAERDLIRGLVKMNLLPRIRYLLASDNSELIHTDPTSVERLVRLLVCIAESGQDVCELIEEEELLEPVVQWGIDQTEWPMTLAEGVRYPSLAAIRLLTIMAQASKHIAETVLTKATSTLRFLLTSPEIAAPSLKQRAYALQLETLKLIRVLACYGFIVPTLEDLQEPVMDWLRASLSLETYASMRASTAIGLLEVLLHTAADPHKTIPAHAIDWHQPTACLPAVLAILRASRGNQQALYESALGYLGSWASYINLFPPSEETVREVWKAVVQEGGVGLQQTNHYLLRHIQFMVAYSSLRQASYQDLVQEANKALGSAYLMNLLQSRCAQDIHSRYALWIWTSQTHKRKWCDDTQVQVSELESGVRSRMQTDVVETWLAQNLLQLCLSNFMHHDLEPFYYDAQEQKMVISKALFEYDGRPLKALMYHQHQTEQDPSAFLLSPIDALYHLDKSKVAQKSRANASVIVAHTLEIADQILTIDHDMAIISLMKIFLIGDREGQQADMVSEREVFWDVPVLDQWLDKCKTRTTLGALEKAWRSSSEHIRQAQVPFYQFYQSFVAQYAAVSFGHHGFARLLVYLVTQIDVIDYRHLVLVDYRDVLSTLKIRKDELPPLTSQEIDSLSTAGLSLL